MRGSPTTDDAILREIGKYGSLTVAQLARLVPKAGHRRTTNNGHPQPAAADPNRYLRERCLVLTERGFLVRRYLPATFPEGKPPAMYWLGQKGKEALAALGLPSGRLLKPSEIAQLSAAHLFHNKAADDLLIAAEVLVRSRPGLWIAELRPHHVVNADPVPVTLPSGTTTTVRIDGWVDFRVGAVDTTDQQCVAWELDNGSEFRADWYGKLERLVAFASGPYQEHFGTTSLRIAVAARPGERRSELLKAWTESFLRESGLPAYYADLFCFAGVDGAAVPPEELYLATRWVSPFRSDPFPLVELEGGA